MGLFDSFKRGLAKTAKLLKTDVRDLFKSEGRLIDDAFLDEMRAILFKTDMGYESVEQIVAEVAKNFRGRVVTLEDVVATWKTKLGELMAQDDAPIRFAESGPTVIMVCGVNGAGINGMFARWGWGARIADVPDGLSNTIMLGEIRPKCGDHYYYGGGWSGFNATWTGTVGPINYDTCGIPTRPKVASEDGSVPCRDIRDWGLAQAFKSRHTGGAHFLMGDGTVKFLSESINWETYQKLGGRRDARPISDVQ